MRTLLECDFFIGDEGDADAVGRLSLKVFPGPRGIIIADTLAHVPAGHWVERGDAFLIPGGIEFVYHSVEDTSAACHARALAMRFVVKDAFYGAGLAYSIRNEHAATAVS